MSEGIVLFGSADGEVRFVVHPHHIGHGFTRAECGRDEIATARFVDALKDHFPGSEWRLIGQTDDGFRSVCSPYGDPTPPTQHVGRRNDVRELAIAAGMTNQVRIDWWEENVLTRWVLHESMKQVVAPCCPRGVMKAVPSGGAGGSES